MTSYPLPTLAPTVSEAGISVVSFSDVQQSLISSAQQIFGSDIYLGNDSQDGQLIGVFSQAINDCNQATAAVFNSFSPTFAQGVQLSSLVGINGLTRNTSNASTASGTVTGTVDSVITGGVVADENGNFWDLPPSVTIPFGGSISVTVTSQTNGDISAPIGTINRIVNPQFGWQAFSNTDAAILGQAVETDPALKDRQSVSTELSAITLTDTIIANIANLTGVIRNGGYDNDSNVTDSNGVPSGALAMVVQGGGAQQIANTIAVLKPPGCKTYGSTSGVYIDKYGVPHVINYSQLVLDQIYFAFSIQRLAGWVITTEKLIQDALANFVDQLAIGEDVYATQCLGIAALTGNAATLALSQTFSINMASFFLGTAASPTSSANIVVAFNHAAACSASNIFITLE